MYIQPDIAVRGKVPLESFKEECVLEHEKGSRLLQDMTWLFMRMQAETALTMDLVFASS